VPTLCPMTRWMSCPMSRAMFSVAASIARSRGGRIEACPGTAGAALRVPAPCMPTSRGSLRRVPRAPVRPTGPTHRSDPPVRPTWALGPVDGFEVGTGGDEVAFAAGHCVQFPGARGLGPAGKSVISAGFDAVETRARLGRKEGAGGRRPVQRQQSGRFDRMSKLRPCAARRRTRSPWFPSPLGP